MSGNRKSESPGDARAGGPLSHNIDVMEAYLDHRLAVVKGAVDGDVVNVVIQNRRHLRKVEASGT